MADLSPNVPTLSINSLNIPIKDKDWCSELKNITYYPALCCSQETHIRYNNIAGWK